MTDHVVRLRLTVSDSDLRRLGEYLGDGKATLRDYRGWAYGKLIGALCFDLPDDPLTPTHNTPRNEMEHHQS